MNKNHSVIRGKILHQKKYRAMCLAPHQRNDLQTDWKQIIIPQKKSLVQINQLKQIQILLKKNKLIR